jgi:hypothetical protein
VPSRSTYLLQYAKYQNGKTTTIWKIAAPLSVIKHPAYMGAVPITRRKKINPYKQKYVDIPFEEQEIIYDCHEAIVSKELWEKANALRLQKKNRRTGKKRAAIQLYSGMLFCAHCGKALKARNNNGVVYLTCICWPLVPRKSGKGMATSSISRHLVNEIRKIALVCETKEEDAFAFIFEHLSPERSSSRIETDIEINMARKQIEILTDKVSNFEQYTGARALQQKQKNTIFAALESELRNQEQKRDILMESDCVMPSGGDIYQFIRAARRYGYIQSIERSMLDELVEKIYITRKMNDTSYQQDRVLVKYKYVGVLSGIYNTDQILMHL